MLDVLHELIDAVAGLKGISNGMQADLHAILDRESAAPKAKPAKAEAEPDVPAGA